MALAPVQIVALGSSVLSEESGVMSGGGIVSWCDLLWTTRVLLDPNKVEALKWVQLGPF